MGTTSVNESNFLAQASSSTHVKVSHGTVLQMCSAFHAMRNGIANAYLASSTVKQCLNHGT